MEWKPIESAPKDGTRILLFGHRGDQFDIGSWGPHGVYIRKTGTYEAAWGSGAKHYVGATHWQPLPTPPSPSKP